MTGKVCVCVRRKIKEMRQAERSFLITWPLDVQKLDWISLQVVTLFHYSQSYIVWVQRNKSHRLRTRTQVGLILKPPLDVKSKDVVQIWAWWTFDCSSWTSTQQMSSSRPDRKYSVENMINTCKCPFNLVRATVVLTIQYHSVCRWHSDFSARSFVFCSQVLTLTLSPAGCWDGKEHF